MMKEARHMPTLAKKKELVTQIQSDIENANVIILADYRGLTDFDMKTLRTRLRAANVGVRVAKNTLIKRVAKGTSLEVLSPELAGPTAMLLGYSEEIGDVVKIVKAFLKEKKKENELRAGFLDGQLLNAVSVDELSNLPTKDELRGKLVMCIASPLQGLARALSYHQTGLVRLLDQISEMKESSN
jgi:large subunit ribosomal protein L10